MEIFGTTNNLDAFLRSLRNKRIDIAVAFASKTEAVVNGLIANGNEVFLTVGTINCFSDPVFFKACHEIAHNNPKLTLAIDFRYDNSIHWKIYLISPNIVIIGSPNLTTIGLSMIRDTAVRIEDENLYLQYKQIISNLRSTEGVVTWNDERFDMLFADYEEQRRKKSFSPTNGPVQSFTEWFAKEETDSLPVFIWKCDFTPEQKTEFEEDVIPYLRVDGSDATDYYSIGCAYNQPHDYEGKVILTIRADGIYAKFEHVLRIIRNNNHWWLCGVKRKRIQKPFVLTTEVKQAVRQLAKNGRWQGKTLLDSNDLRELEKILLAQQ